MRIQQIVETTTAGSVATVAQPMMTQTRENTNVKGLKPVQQVIKGKAIKKGPYANSIVESKVTEDDLAEQDLIVIPGQGRLKRTGFVKHDLDQGEHEGHTLKNSLHTIARAASELDKRLSVQSEFPEWVSEKIGAAKGMMVSVMDYLISSQEMQHDSDAIESVAEGLDYNQRARLDDLIDTYRNATDPSNDGYGIDDHYDPDEVLDKIRQEFGDNVANKVEAGTDKMHFLRHGNQRGDPLGWRKPVDRITKAGKMYKQDSDYMKNTIKSRYKLSGKSATEGVAEGSLNEFAPDGFNGGNDGDEFSPEIAKMAQEDGFTKGASLADGATLERAITINHWHSQHGGMYKQYFAKGFKTGRMNKISHDNKQYNLNLKLMKDGSIRHGEQGVAEGDMYGDAEVSWEKGGRRAPTGAFRNPNFGNVLQKSVNKHNKAIVKTRQDIGSRVADIGAGGKEYNVKTDAAWDAAKKKVSEGSKK